jgi:hypothetical protein
LILDAGCSMLDSSIKYQVSSIKLDILGL